jgi:hypothetical protein
VWIHLLTLELIDGASEAETLRGRRRRRHRPWQSVLARADEPTPALVAQERKIVQQMLVAAEIEELISEQKILRGALDQAAKRQATAISGMIDAIDRRITEIHDEDDEILTLLGA